MRDEQRDERVSVVIATRNRACDLGVTLGHLTELPERPQVVVVDNASTDDTVAMVRREYPDVDVHALTHNRWAAARTIGARLVGTPSVAFRDDDSWWAPGALRTAAAVFDAHPRLGLLAGRVLVGSGERLDPTCEVMAHTPLPQSPDMGQASILGFIACGAIVRRSAFLQAGGFHARFEVGGEEELLALDLAVAGWGLAYREDVVAHHHPSPARDPAGRRRRQIRNLLWTSWLRHPLPAALSRSASVIGGARRDRGAATALVDALRGLPWVVRSRRRIPAHLEVSLERLNA